MGNILQSVRLRYLSRKANLPIELKQSEQEGRDLSSFRPQIEKLLSLDDTPETEAQALEFYQAFQNAPTVKGFPYLEPESLKDIVSLFPNEEAVPQFSQENLKSRLLGALAGRTAGCLLGQPVECWTRSRICGLLQDTGNYPIRNYISSNIGDALRQKYEVTDAPGNYGNAKKSWLNLIDGTPEDDDTNYTVMGLKIMEDYGLDFTPMDAAECFTTNVPAFISCTAERMAYKNIVNGVLPPESASFGNPYREWLGGQIRVDSYAYVNPGRPGRAAQLAIRDAAVTHTKNGIYASAFCAALISAAASSSAMDEAITTALSYTPPKSRLREKLSEFLALAGSGKDEQSLIRFIHEQYDENDPHDWCHVLPNDMVICLSLLRGGRDFDKVVGLSVEAGFDTDCNAATAGSAFGMMYGIEAIPQKWTGPLKGGFRTRIGCQGWVSFEDLVSRYFSLIKL